MGLLLRRFDQIGADFDQQVEAAMMQGMTVDGIAGQVSVIRFIVPDHEALTDLLGLGLEDGRGFERFDERIGQAFVIGGKNADLPRPTRAVFQLRGKAVHGADCHVVPPCAEGGIGVVIGAVEQGEATLYFRGIGVPVLRNDRSVIEFHHQRRIIFSAVRVDHEARKICVNHRTIEKAPQFAADPQRSDIIGDMARHIFCADAEIWADLRRNPVRGMVTCDEPAPRSAAAFDVKRGLVGHFRVTFCCHGSNTRFERAGPVVPKPSLRHRKGGPP